MITITLPPKLGEALTERAQEQGTTADILAIDSLEKLYLASEVQPEEGQSLADYWADYIGTVDSGETVAGGANLSRNTGHKFAELMVEKYRQTKP